MSKKLKKFTIQDLAELLASQSSSYADFLADSKTFLFSIPPESQGEGVATASTFKPDTDIPLFENCGGQGEFNRWALQQIKTLLNEGHSIDWLLDPTSCSAEYRAHLLNEQIAIRDSQRWLVRERDEGLIRAVLSDEYKVFDNVKFIDMVGLALDAAGFNATVYVVRSGDHLRVWFVDETKLFGELGKEGGLYPSLKGMNSEVGDGGLWILGGVLRGVCVNGMVWGWKQQSKEIIRHRWYDDGTMLGMVKAALIVACKMTQEAAENFQKATAIPVVFDDLKTIIDGWIEKASLPIEVGTNWLQSTLNNAADYGRRREPHLFDLVNGLTYVAQGLSMHEQDTAENLAGEVLRNGVLRYEHTQVR